MTKEFRQKVRKALLPFLEECSFKQYYPVIDGKAIKSRDFVYLARDRGERLHLIAIQFSRHIKPWFVFFISDVPNEPYETPAGYIFQPQGLDAMVFEERTIFLPKKIFSFGAFRPSRIKTIVYGKDKSFDDMMKNFKDNYYQVEDWFLSKKQGKNINTYNMGYEYNQEVKTE